MGNYTADHFVDGMFNDTGSSGNSESNGSDNMMSGGNMMGGNQGNYINVCFDSNFPWFLVKLAKVREG